MSSSPSKAAGTLTDQLETQPSTTRVSLFVIGHPSRGDDGAAEAALKRVSRQALEGVDVVRAHDLDVETLMGAGPVVVVDAIRGPAPGTIVVWTLAEVAELPEAPTASTHGLPLPAVLKLAAALGGHPLHGRFVGIAGARFIIGSQLSAPVRAALPAAARAIESAIRDVVTPCA
jgi:hydrogenase maturation protease